VEPSYLSVANKGTAPGKLKVLRCSQQRSCGFINKFTSGGKVIVRGLGYLD